MRSVFDYRQLVCWAAVLGLLTTSASVARAAISEDQVLVIYNSAGADTDSDGTSDSEEVYLHYQSKRTGVLSLDLNDATLGAGNISYADFESKVRDPIRTYLNDNSLASDVVAITLTKGLPHRIQDTDNANVGDDLFNVSAEFFTDSDATYASVDSELTLLWQDLSTGESGGTMDSSADNLVVNPYHTQSLGIETFDRSGITDANSFENNENLYWEMEESTGPPANSDAGDMYLVTRLDGNTVAQVNASIDRAQNIVFDQLTDALILDENDGVSSGGDEFDDTAFFDPKSADPGYQGNDYDETATLLAGLYDRLIFDEKNTAFLVGESGSIPDTDTETVTGPVAVLSTFGGNHDGDNQNEYVFTYQGQLVDGAIFNSLESFNGRPFGGLPEFGDQGSLAEWIAAGGTLGVGNVWEPFSPTVADNEFLLNNFLFGGMTWAEAAYSSLPWLSWQQVVIGDPLATATVVIPEPASPALLGVGTLLLAGRRRRG